MRSIAWGRAFQGTQLIVGIAVLLSIIFFADRVAGLWQHPFRSAVKGWDNTFYYLWLRGPMVRGDLDFRRDLLETDTMSALDKARAIDLPLTAAGHFPNKYGVGWALSSLPWYGMGSIVTRLADLFGAKLPLDGYGPYYQFCLMLGQLVYAGIGLRVACWLIARHVPETEALFGTLLIWMGSFLFYYQTTNLSMAHNLNFFAQMGAYGCAYQLEREPARRRYWLGIGIFSGLCILARYQSAVLLIYPFVQVIRMSVGRSDWKGPLLTGVTLVLAILPQLLAWKIVYGHYLVYSYGEEGFDWSSGHWIQVLFSSWHGLFYWHPLLLAGTVGFSCWCWFSRNWIAGCWIGSLLLTYAVNALWGCWWFGSAFGLRAFDGCIFFQMLGFGWLLHRCQSRPLVRQALLGVAAVLVCWNIQLAWLARKDRLNLESPVSHQRMLQTVEAFWQGR